MLRVAAGYMLETPSIRRYSFVSHPRHTLDGMSSENPSGADNQQERPGIEQWIVGFVDGEGCFSIAVVRNRVCRLGWQAQHEFSVTQAAPSRPSLELLREYFGCGSLIENQRHDDHRHPLMRYSVKRRSHLRERIVPFFEEHPLITAKGSDFRSFVDCLELIEAGEHLNEDGLRRIARITEQMNRRQRSRFLESSEAIRQPPHLRH